MARLPRGSVTAGHMTAQLDAAAELNSNNSESMQTDVHVHTKLTACKFDICNAADSFGEAVWANLRSHSIYAVCVPKKIENACGLKGIKFTTWLHLLKR